MSEFGNLKELEAAIIGLPQYELRDVFVGPQKNQAEKHVAVVEKGTEQLPEAIVSDKYCLVQHRNAFMPFVNVCRAIGLNVHGSIYQQEGKAFIKARFDDPRAKVVIGKDETEMGILIGNSVDGSMGVFTEAYGFRLVCSNGMIVRSLVAHKHRIHVGAADEDLKDHYESFIEQIMESSPRLKDMIERAMAEHLQEAVINQALYGAGFTKRHVELLLDKCKQLDVKNKWDLYNTITSWLTHEMEVKWASERWHQSKADKLLSQPIAVLVEKGKEVMKTSSS